MSYLGRGVDKISNIETLDNITFDGSSSYTLQKGGVNFNPISAAAILISIDGIVQSGNFTVSSSTIDFGTAVAGTSTCNFIIHLGTGVLTAPSDGSVSSEKIADDAVTEAKLNLISTSSVPSLEAKGDGSSQDGYIQLNCSQNSHGIKLKSPPHSAGQSYTLTFPQSISNNTFLKTDGSGNLSFASTNYPAFDAYITSNQTISGGSVTKATFNNEVLDTDNCYDASTNYRFTPTVAGKYYIYLNLGVNGGGAGRLNSAYGMIYKNGSEVTKYHLNTQNENIFYANMPTFVIVDMNGSSDYIEAYGEANVTSGSANYQSGGFSRFGGFRIGV